MGGQNHRKVAISWLKSSFTLQDRDFRQGFEGSLTSEAYHLSHPAETLIGLT